MENNFAHFREMLGEVIDLQLAAAVLEWDQQTYMPESGAQPRAMQLGTLMRLAHSKFVHDDFAAALEQAKASSAQMDPDSDEAGIVRYVEREFQRQRRVPTDWVAEDARTTALARQAWEKARADSDFAHFRPHLEKVIELRRQYAGFFAPYDHVYDPLLDVFEPGMKTSQVKTVFETLRPQQVELVREIAERGAPVDDSMLHRRFAVQKQWGLGVEIITAFGYDFKGGRQDKTAHPFTTAFGIGDVRITTRHDPNFLPSGLFSTLHEAGHALYVQGMSPALDRTPLLQGASFAVHESQSRMWENLVGRSRPFWTHYYPRLQKLFPRALGDVDVESFYRAINRVQRSLIRVEADEATYNLHVMLRFEIEIALLDRSLEVKDLPQVWNHRMQEYLGLTPPNDAQGVLQDIHWSSGYIGYFPTYALGNLIACQLWEKIRAEIPDLERQIERGEFGELLGWLRQKIHRHGGKFEPADLVQRVTGSGITSEPYLRYLRSKYGEIYKL